MRTLETQLGYDKTRILEILKIFQSLSLAEILKINDDNIINTLVAYSFLEEDCLKIANLLANNIEKKEWAYLDHHQSYRFLESTKEILSFNVHFDCINGFYLCAVFKSESSKIFPLPGSQTKEVKKIHEFSKEAVDHIQKICQSLDVSLSICKLVTWNSRHIARTNTFLDYLRNSKSV